MQHGFAQNCLRVRNTLMSAAAARTAMISPLITQGSTTKKLNRAQNPETSRPPKEKEPGPWLQIHKGNSRRGSTNADYPDPDCAGGNRSLFVAGSDVHPHASPHQN